MEDHLGDAIIVDAVQSTAPRAVSRNRRHGSDSLLIVVSQLDFDVFGSSINAMHREPGIQRQSAGTIDDQHGGRW